LNNHELCEDDTSSQVHTARSTKHIWKKIAEIRLTHILLNKIFLP